MSQPKIKASALDLESLPLTGTPTAPTAPVGTNTDQIATTAYVKNEIPAVLWQAGVATYWRNAAASLGLTWAYYGGTVVTTTGAVVQVADGAILLTATATNYVVASRSTGAVSSSTTTTNWDDVAGFWRLYNVTCTGSTITGFVDMRAPCLYTGGTIAPAVVNETGTALTALPSTAGCYTRFTNAATKVYTFDSAQPYAVGTEYQVRNVGAGSLTLAGAGTFTLNPPVGGSLVLAQGGSATVKIVGATEADVVV